MNLFTDLVYRRIPQAVGVYVTGAWFGVEVASVIFEAFEFPQAAQRTVILLALAGFPLAMVFGWRYNLTARGIERTPEKAGWFARFFLAVILITIVAASIMVQRGALTTSADATRSVAVLAMRDGSQVQEDAGLGQALGDEILLELSALQGMRVVARTTSYGLSNTVDDVQRLVEELDVQFVIEGSLQRSPGRLRAIVSIVDARTGYCVWTGAFEDAAGDAPMFAENVAAGVVQHLAGIAGLAAPDLQVLAQTESAAISDDGLMADVRGSLGR